MRMDGRDGCKSDLPKEETGNWVNNWMWRRRQEVRSDIIGELLLLVSPCVPLFPGFYDKNCSHLPFLAPGILLLGLGMPKAEARLGLRSTRCDTLSFKVKCIKVHIERFSHDALRDMSL